MATSFCVSLCRGDTGKLLSSLVLVKVLHQGEKATEPCDHTQDQKNQGQPGAAMKIAIQVISDGHPDGHGEAHLEANGAVTHDPFVEPLPVLLHRNLECGSPRPFIPS